MDEFHTYSVLNDLFDMQHFQGVFEDSSKLQETLGPKRLAIAPQLGQDGFESLWKDVPQLREADQVELPS